MRRHSAPYEDSPPECKQSSADGYHRFVDYERRTATDAGKVPNNDRHSRYSDLAVLWQAVRVRLAQELPLTMLPGWSPPVMFDIIVELLV